MSFGTGLQTMCSTRLVPAFYPRPLTILGMLILPLGSIFHVGSIPKRARFGARPGPGLLRFEPQKLVDELR